MSNNARSARGNAVAFAASTADHDSQYRGSIASLRSDPDPEKKKSVLGLTREEEKKCERAF